MLNGSPGSAATEPTPQPRWMDIWEAANRYDDFMGRWSRPLAVSFLDWLRIPPGSSWLDVGCGTGALTATILAQARPGRVAAVDPSPGFVAAARQGLGGHPDLRVGDAQALPFDGGEFDAVVSGLALNFVPDPDQAGAELIRVTRGGGAVAAYVWDYASGMEMLRVFWDAAVALDPGAATQDEAVRFPLCDPVRLTALFAGSGLADVEVTGLEIPTVFEGFDDRWEPLTGGQGPAPGYVASLRPPGRERLRRELRRRLPSVEARIRLRARAWAVRGTAPPKPA